MGGEPVAHADLVELIDDLKAWPRGPGDWTERKATRLMDRAAAELTRLRAEIARKDEALRFLRSFGCPVCNGDCASANPPVTTCPMQTISAALKEPNQ